jgi:hypothetical protein
LVELFAPQYLLQLTRKLRLNALLQILQELEPIKQKLEFRAVSYLMQVEFLILRYH